MKNKKKKWLQFCNVLCIYVIQSIIYILLKCISSNIVQTNTVVSIKDLSELLIYPVGHFWYLHGLCIFYLFDYLLEIIVKRKRVIILLSISISLISILGNNYYTSKLTFMFFFFEIGKYGVKIEKKFMIFLLLGLGFILPFYTEDIWYYIFMKVVVAFSISLLMIILFRKFMNVNTIFLNHMGINSIWIYLYHSYFVSVCRNICNRIIPEQLILRIVFCSMAGILGPLVVQKIFRKFKIEYFVSKPIRLVSTS